LIAFLPFDYVDVGISREKDSGTFFDDIELAIKITARNRPKAKRYGAAYELYIAIFVMAAQMSPNLSLFEFHTFLRQRVSKIHPSKIKLS
jgi:hypothetical protein